MLTGQANGTIRCVIELPNTVSVTFIPDNNHIAESPDSKFATFLPMNGEQGFFHLLQANGAIQLGDAVALEGAMAAAATNYFGQALLNAASHGTKVTAKVTKDNNGNLTLNAITIPTDGR